MEKKEIYTFQSEVKQLLHLMIHSLYSNKEIFLRELISNASDAVDKLRFLALSSPELYEQDINLKVRISIDKKNRTIVIEDNGIGMSKDEVIENLGTIAKSGTKSFLNSLSCEKKIDDKFIGQFGVGFYSAFIVSKKVSVLTRSAGKKNEDAILWESNGDGEYSISNIKKDTRGTKIVLHLREEEKEFLDSWKIENIVKKYSNHINLPIEIKIEENNKKSYWKQINKAEALWSREKSNITEKEYKNFYKNLTQDSNDPLAWSHNFVEGNQEYTSLLYIPHQAPSDLWNHEYQHGLKLYVQRVFIMDHVAELIPHYLRFTCGLIDSKSLPLNISREILQNNRTIQIIKNKLTKRILNILKKLADEKPEKYQIFWKNFGLIFKEGPAEDIKNISIISNLLRFYSTRYDSEKYTISLKEYVEKMPSKQEKIFFLSSDNYNSAKNSPHLEYFYKNNIEVLLFIDRIDEWMINYIKDFDGKKFQSVSKEDSISSFEEKNLIQTKEKDLLQDHKNTFLLKVKEILGNQVKEVRLSNRLTNSPAIVVTEKKDLSTQMKKLLSAAGHTLPEIKYLFEINSEHKLIKKIIMQQDSIHFSKWIKLIFYQALLQETGTLKNVNEFVNITNDLLLL